MDYDKKYRLTQAPHAHRDGSGMVAHSITAIARPTTADPADPWVTIPGRSQTINVPSVTLQSALAQPTNPTRVAAYKDALVANINTQNVPVTGWDLSSLETLLDQNDLALEVATDANAFILSVASTYPVDFTI